MPEGPESQILVDGLSKLTKDRTLMSVEPIGGRYTTKLIPCDDSNFSRMTHPFNAIARHGKAVVMDVGTSSVVVTLGMTGKFSLQREKHSAVEFLLDIDFLKQRPDSFNFVDQRRFGTVRIVSKERLDSVLPKLGWDALSQEVDVDRVQRDIRDIDSDRPIGSILLDGSVFSGIGNYLRAEILYAARISPWKRRGQLTAQDLESICTHARRISLRSYELGGNTIENFFDLSGTSGKFFEELLVYGKRKDPDGNEVIAEKTPEGRTVHWVPSVQVL